MTIDTTYLDADTDNISLARPALLATAVFCNDLAASTGAAMVGAIGSGTGAVARTQQAKNRDVVSAADFGGGAGNAAADLAAIVAGIAALKANGRGGVLVVPSNFVSSVQVPALALAASQAIAVEDQRVDKLNSGNDSFGTMETYLEARDSSGGYATEKRLRGKQNPAYVLNTVSDGTAPGYAVVNKATSFMHLANGANWYQLMTDPHMKGYADYALYQYTNGGSGSFAIRFGSDNSFKTRIDVTPINFATTSTTVVSASNASPIRVVTSTPHKITGAKAPCSISGALGNTAANGSWLVDVINSTTIDLINSTGNGAYTSGGTLVGQDNAQRATLNIPKVQGGTEAIVSEGTVVITIPQGTVPIAALSTTVDASLHARPYVVSQTGVQQVSGAVGSGGSKIVTFTVQLTAGSKVVTLTGGAVFTSAGSYVATASSQNSATAVKVSQDSGSQITLTGTGTDFINVIAVGY